LKKQWKAQKKGCPQGQVLGPNGCYVPLASDVRLKRDVVLVAILESGIKLYSFRYLWSDETYVGVMAQDLLSDPALRQAANLQANGYYAVDYGRLGLRMATFAEWQARGLASVRLDAVVSVTTN
jgi:hypothetical protein